MGERIPETENVDEISVVENIIVEPQAGLSDVTTGGARRCICTGCFHPALPGGPRCDKHDDKGCPWQ